MNTAFLAIIKQITAREGEAILGDPARLKGFVKSGAADVPKELRRAFGRCVEAGYYRVLKQTSDCRMLKPQLARQLQAAYGIDHALCGEALDILEAAITNTTKLPFWLPRLSQKAVLALAASAALILIVVFSYMGVFAGQDEFEPIVEFHNEAFPVKIIATAAAELTLDGRPRMIETRGYIGDSIGDFGAKLNGGFWGRAVRVEIEGDRFIKKSALDARVTGDAELFPRINYNYAELGKLTQPMLENVTFRLFVNNRLKKEAFETVTFHSLNEVPFGELSRHNTYNNYHYMFAAMVNEDHPFINTILKEALRSGAIRGVTGSNRYNTFAGYQDVDNDGGTEKEVIAQVFALWYVLQNHNIHYSNINRTSTESDYLASQYVRSIEDTYTNVQANCVDGSVLFASILRKIGIDPFLVLIPGHMFVGFYLDEDNKIPQCLETTIMGSEDITRYGKNRIQVSFDLFTAALKSGNKTFLATEEPERIIIDIAQCRAAGIRPVRRE